MFDAYIREIKEVVRVLDGDTVELCVDLGHNTFHISKYRLKGFDAPETWRPINKFERAAGKRVTEYLKDLLNTHEGNLCVRTSKDPQIYGRYTAEVFTMETIPVNICALVEKFMVDNAITKEQVRAYKE